MGGGGRIALVRDDVGGPAEAAVAQPGFGEAIGAMRFDQGADRGEVAALRSGGEGKRDRAEAEIEQPVAECRLAVVIALGRRRGDDFDLAIVEPEALVDAGDLWLEPALFSDEQPPRAALADARRACPTPLLRKDSRGEDAARLLFPLRLHPFHSLSAPTGI